MIDVKGTTIHCTRGDEGSLDFSYKDANGQDVEFDVGQNVVFKVYERKDVSKVVLLKNITVAETCTSVEIPLTTEDTSIGDLINKPVKYFYEISIDDSKTVIGYDDDGPKEFILYPEGGSSE